MASGQNIDVKINKEALRDLLNLARGHLYSPLEPYKNDDKIPLVCLNLFEKDFECLLIKNFGTKLKTYYPESIIVPLRDKHIPKFPILGNSFSESDEAELKEIFINTKLARQYCRIVVPTILFNGNFICRSAAVNDNAVQSVVNKEVREIFQNPEFEYQMNLDTAVFIFLHIDFEKGINNDVNLLKRLKVKQICDLRTTKKAYGTPNYPDIVLSTEGMFDKIYNDFTVAHMPYPGIECFKNFNAIQNPEVLCYNWSRLPGAFKVHLPKIDSESILDKSIETINQNWNMYDFTQNYLLVLLKYISYGNGILVHCVMGLDRTPVFITLIRLSLWADGLIHQSLSPEEMLYLTFAYDWYLFGHDLPKCILQNLQIMYFCFNNLNIISSSKFSMRKSEVKTAEESGSASTPAETKRQEKLRAVRDLFLENYG